jgi:anti-anti-sigma factor
MGKPVGAPTSLKVNQGDFKMGIENWSEDVILVKLPAEPQAAEQLAEAIRVIRDRGDCDVVVDFSLVDVLTSSSLAQLVRLRKLLFGCRHKLTLCRVGAATKSIFSVTGLNEIFTMVDEESDVLATPETPN